MATNASRTRRTETIDSLTSAYGPGWREGILTEHLHRLGSSIKIAVTTTGLTYAYPATGGRAVPVVCSELIEVPTESGPIVGRCGTQVLHDRFACTGHADERERWSNLSEVERAEIERREDADDYHRGSWL